MKKTYLSVVLSLVFITSIARQITIPRIEQMPNLPSPYLMRDWKKVAVDYDNFVFDVSKTGTYLPLTAINTGFGVNYPSVQNIKMDTYVGQKDHGNVAESINIIPAIVGASLVGIDKTNHLNTNWVTKVKDFYNLKNGQLVYLNNYSTTTGNDWWYEVMPNVFFYQLLSLYPNADADFNTQFIRVADRELEMLGKLGGGFQPWTIPNMNYRAFNFITGVPNSSSVPEPETAGSVSWLLYQAYLKTQNPTYLQGAQLAMDFLKNWTSNPSYEIQLPYGIAAAARMNAVEGTNYDVEKMLNWTFSSGLSTLRRWGTIVGKWNGYDVSGLIGEANDAGNDYAFSMNGYQHAAALAPVAKYDKRFARAIAKWMLNMANASRLFYKNGLPVSNQQTASYNWANQYDVNACIPYEAIKQTWSGVSPFAMGDAVKGGWAFTDLSLYSGSSVGYMASIINTTNVNGVLQIDLNKTDFRGDNTYPTFLYYNPNPAVQNVSLSLPAGNFDIYDAVSETVIKTNVSGTNSFSIDPDNVRLLVIYPAGKTTTINGRFKSVNGVVVDYHTSYNYTNPLRIKVFTASDTIVQKTYPLELYCLVENNTSTNINYDWYQNDVKIASTQTNTFSWNSPNAAGYYNLKCIVSENGVSVASHSLKLKVVDELLIPPVVNDILFSAGLPFESGSTITASAKINTPSVQYLWKVNSGTLINETTTTPTWNIPLTPGIYDISLTVTNSSGTNTFTKSVLVKSFASTTEPTPIIYYPFNGDTKNYAQNGLNAVNVNAVLALGANNQSNSAYSFPSSASYIYTPNETALNFTDKISVSFWVKPDLLPNYEQFILSHGSWEERYKISITPEKKVRWTVKTTNSIVDVDADTVAEQGKFVHYTAVYTGYSMELYRNGHLSNFKPLTGSIRTTTKNLTIARKDDATTDWSLRGTVDEVRIYNTELSQNLLGKLPSTFTLLSNVDNVPVKEISVYPNPFADVINVELRPNEKIESISVYDMPGRLIYNYIGEQSVINLTSLKNGVYILDIQTNKGKYKIKAMKRN